MQLVTTAARMIERAPWPDTVAKAGVSLLVGRTSRRLARAAADASSRFAGAMQAYPVAEHAAAANAQHYELPAAFFARVLGPRRKYSCCLYDSGTATLAEAEERALVETARNADLADGQSILDLGCGWGALSLWMAERYPAARILAVSNSRAQHAHIVGAARARRLDNLQVVTADMNDFAAPHRFDRVVSVEMFEHMANWRLLLARIRSWLEPHGRLFVHIFSHQGAPYRFDHRNPNNWIARHFFTGGIMPSHDLMHQFGDCVAVEAEWRWSGLHYRRTALDWLANYDRHAAAIAPILDEVYGPDAALWRRRWRLFFLATAGLFGHADGTEWGVSHYRLRAA